MRLRNILLLACAFTLLLPAALAAEGDFTYDASSLSLSAYTGSDTEVVIPASVNGGSVEKLGRGLFQSNTAITCVAVPEGVRVIDSFAFYGNDALTSVTLPESLVVIDGSNFYYDTSLTSVTIPAGVALIGDYCFYSCDALREIRFEGVCPVISDRYTFCYLPDDAVIYVPDDQLAAYTAMLPDDVTVVGSGKTAVAAESGSRESDFTVSPDGVLTGYSGTSLWVSVPESVNGVKVTAVGDGAFERTDAYRIDLPEGVVSIGSSAFASSNHLRCVTLPSTLVSIGDNAFAWACFVRFDLPEGLEEIGSGAFSHADVASPLVLPAGLRTIGSEAFFGCDCFTDVYFGDAIESIGDRAFAENYITYLNFAGYTLPAFGEDVFDTENLADLDMPWDTTYDDWAAAVAAFAEVAPDCVVWRNNPISAGVAEYPENSADKTTITDGFLTSYSGEKPDLTIWTLYDGVEVIGLGDGVFRGNQTIRSFYPHHCDTFTTIGAEAFADSTVAYVEIYDSITTIGENAFRNCVNMKSVTLPFRLTDVAANAFAGCTGIESVVIDCDPSILPAGLFADCENLTSVTVTRGTVPTHMFEGRGITVLAIGKGVNVAEYAFADTAIASLDLSDAGEIGACAFANIPAECVVLPAAGKVDATAFTGVDRTLIRIADGATDEVIARLSEGMGYPWHSPMLRVSEESALVNMPYEATPGEYFEFDAATGTITGYTGSDPDVVIPRAIDGVTVKAIGYNAFDACRDYTGTEVTTNRTQWVPLRSVVIPGTVEKIEDGAFSYCQQLHTFICYAPLDTTGKATFQYCKGLKNVVFVNGVLTLDNYCFDQAGDITLIYTAGKLRTIASQAFNMTEITSAVVDAENVVNCAFCNCPYLTEIHFTSRVAGAECCAVNGCGLLGTVCFEMTDMSFAARDGILGEPAGTLNIYVDPDMDEENIALAGKCVAWSMTQRTVTVTPASCNRLVWTEDTLDTDALLGMAREVEMPVFAVAEPEPAVTMPVPVPNDTSACLGTWYLQTLDGYSAADFGLSMSVTFDPAGTAVLCMTGEGDLMGVWQEDNGTVTLYSEGIVYVFTMEDDALGLQAEGMEMVFGRESGETDMTGGTTEEVTPAPTEKIIPEPAEEATPAPMEEPAGAEYAGKWYCVYCSLTSLEGDPRERGIAITLTLNEDGTGCLDLFGETQDAWYADESGEAAFGDLPMAIMDGGFLHLGSGKSGFILFSRDEGAVWTPAG